MRAVPDADGSYASVTRKFGRVECRLIHRAGAMCVVCIQRAGTWPCLGEGHIWRAIKSSAEDRRPVMWQQAEAVTVNAMQAGMKHGACCVTGRWFIRTGIRQDRGAEGGEARRLDNLDAVV
jgi:hypothetical protein